ncbi:DnaJ C-terminal domain-containing protein [soil metagenome]
MAAYKDYYDVLGVPKTATQKEIRAAFRKKAAKLHPDRNPDDATAEEKFKEVNEAYTVLNDEEKRKFYDQFGTEGGRPPFNPGAGGGGGGVYTNINPEDVAGFSDFFQGLFGGGGFSGGGFTTGGYSTRGSDPFADFRAQEVRRPRLQNVEATLEIDLMTAYRCGATTISINDRRIDVTSPKGTRDGAKLRLKGQAPGGGDLYLVVKLEPHPTFRLNGDQIRVTVDAPDYKAVLGGTVRVPTLDGDVEMTLPKGSQTGRVLRLRGQGWPKRDGTRGDELAEVRIVIPSPVTDVQRELYEQLQQATEAEVTAAD